MYLAEIGDVVRIKCERVEIKNDFEYYYIRPEVERIEMRDKDLGNRILWS